MFPASVKTTTTPDALCIYVASDSWPFSTLWLGPHTKNVEKGK